MLDLVVFLPGLISSLVGNRRGRQARTRTGVVSSQCRVSPAYLGRFTGMSL